MARRTHKLTIPSRTSQLALVRRHVAEWADEAGLPKSDADALQMAVDEACANAIEHGYEGRTDGTVDVVARLSDDALSVTVCHRGKPFDPELHRLTALTDMRDLRRKHGYGLHLMHKLVDDVQFTAKGARCEVCLVKRRNGKSGSD